MVRGLTEAIFRRAGQPYIRGHYHVRGNQLYVNRGLGFGFGGPYLRRGTYPEVAFFTLRHGETAAWRRGELRRSGPVPDISPRTEPARIPRQDAP